MRSSGGPPGGSLLIVADGLAESPGEPTTLKSAATPALDRLSGRGELVRLDPQDGAPMEAVTSERGVAALLGLGRAGDALPSRGGLLSLLADSLPLRAPSPRPSWFYVATPVCYSSGERAGLLQSYVNDPTWESDLWEALLPRLPAERKFDLLPVFDRTFSSNGSSMGSPRGTSRGSSGGEQGGRILRMVAAFSGPVAGEGMPASGLPPRTGRLRGEAVAPPDLLEWFAREVTRFDLTRGRRGGPGEPGLWLWGGGLRPELPRLPPPGRSLVAQAPLVRALGRMAGYSDLPLCRATGETDTDLGEKLAQVVAALLSGARRVVLHVEGFDMASHRKDPEGKRRFLERFDREVLEPLSRMLHSGDLGALGLTSDHRSSPLTGNHDAGPVPALLVTGDALKRPERSGARMTEAAAESAPVLPMDEWNDRLFSEEAAVAGCQG